MATSCPQWCAVPGDQRQRATSWEGGWAWTLGGRGARWYPPRWHARWVELFPTVSYWQDGLPQVTRTRSCLDTSRPRTWCTSSSSSQTTGTLRAFGWTVGKSRIHWMQSSHSDRILKMIHFLWKKTHFSWKKIHFSWTIKIPIFSFIGTKQIRAFSIETFLVFQGIHEYIVKSKKMTIVAMTNVWPLSLWHIYESDPRT